MNSAVPDGWDISTIGNITKSDSLFSDGDWVESKDQDPLGNNRLIQLADIGDGTFINKSSRFMNDEQFNRLKCTELKEGDVLIARMPEPLGRSCIFPALNQKCATVVDIAVIRTNVVNHYWLMSVINSSYFRRQMELNASGTTRTRIARGALSNIKLLSPPLPEQQKIASILTSVDDVIEKTESQISKLQDLKNGMMQELLTKGIGHTEFKDSLVGRIPVGWEVVPLSEVTLKIADRDHTTPKYVDSKMGMPIVSPTNLDKNMELNLDKLKYISQEAHEKNRKKTDLKPDDIIFSRIGAGLGKSFLVKNDFWDFSILHSLCQIRVAEMVLPSYLDWHLKSDYLQKRLWLGVQSIGVPDLGLGEIGHLPVILPTTIQEQLEIVKVLDSMKMRINTVITKRRKLISIKKSLMQDLLTGKVRVN